MQNGNHVELAMEWLFANPEAAAAADTTAATAQQAGDDEQLAAMVADALAVDGRRLGMLAEVSGRLVLSEGVALPWRHR